MKTPGSMKTDLLLFPSHFDTHSGILPCKPYLLFIVETSYYLSHPSRLFFPYSWITWSTSLGAQEAFFPSGFPFHTSFTKAWPFYLNMCLARHKIAGSRLRRFFQKFTYFVIMVYLSSKLIRFISLSYIPSHTAT